MVLSMITKSTSRIILTIVLATLLGCSSNSKEEKYNRMTPNEIYAEGVRHVEKKYYSEAIEDFEALESRYPFGDYADKAQIGAVYAYFLNEDYPAALPAVERFIRMYPRHPHVDYAYYMKGLIHFSEAMGYWNRFLPLDREDRDPTAAKKALNNFNILVQTFPQSEYIEDAKLRMVYLRNLLADNELVAARFYMQKGAYMAAANRASFVVANFDQSPSLPEALAIMVEAYRKLELPRLANDSYQVLALNYPNSHYLKKLS